MSTLAWQDLIAHAVRMEEYGRDFYNRQAALAKDSDTAEVFRMLAAEEAEHAAMFSRGLPGSLRPEDLRRGHRVRCFFGPSARFWRG